MVTDWAKCMTSSTLLYKHWDYTSACEAMAKKVDCAMSELAFGDFDGQAMLL